MIASKLRRATALMETSLSQGHLTVGTTYTKDYTLARGFQMSAENIEFHDRLDRVEKRLAFRKSWVAVLLLVNGFVLGAISSCTRTTSDTIEARRIVLKDPS